MVEKKQKGITLIVLVITIIILLILSGVIIMLLTGENGILNKSTIAANETNKQTATEIMNLKITNVQIENYAKNQEMPTLQILADALCEDGEIEYVKRKGKEIASLEHIKILSGEDTILTKLKEYPYQFEIDGKLRLASINGVKVADSSDSKLAEKLEKLETTVSNLQTEHLKSIESLQTENQELKNKVETLENETIVNKRINLMNTSVDIPISTTDTNRNIDIPLSGDIDDYKYIEIQLDAHYKPEVDNHMETTTLIATEQLGYTNSDTVNWGNNSTFLINVGNPLGGMVQAVAWFKDNKTLHIQYTITSRADWDKLRIRNIYGIK